MVRARNDLAIQQARELLQVELVAVIDESITSTKRTEEVQELIVKMILLGRKKGRPPLKEQEFENAA